MSDINHFIKSLKSVETLKSILKDACTVLEHANQGDKRIGQALDIALKQCQESHDVLYKLLEDVKPSDPLNEADIFNIVSLTSNDNKWLAIHVKTARLVPFEWDNVNQCAVVKEGGNHE
jgi:hypothetical protein